MRWRGARRRYAGRGGVVAGHVGRHGHRGLMPLFADSSPTRRERSGGSPPTVLGTSRSPTSQPLPILTFGLPDETESLMYSANMAVDGGKLLNVLQIPMSVIIDQAVEKHADCLPALKVLDISNCLNITSRGIEALGRTASCSFC
ncbi:hypothetical protein U9M48_032725 [Paspalum notatum var. saurae]|uniref:Uncharacterized protein n=1 Tax=Paspalum notatum var. saurae TaxID=547442 RepID=A0AAQ3U997_PASNO